jgi:hypothetical protein
MLTGATLEPGAYPCVGLITLEDYLNELRAFDIRTYETDMGSIR